jgi:hypothetical protein
MSPIAMSKAIESIPGLENVDPKKAEKVEVILMLKFMQAT